MSRSILKTTGAGLALALMLGVSGAALAQDYPPMRDVWIAVRASLRSVLEQITLADVVGGELPSHVRELLADEDAWVSH